MPRLFISCVSNEFASYRDALRKDFTRANLETKIQEDFVAYGSATMEKLDEYIQYCDAVIHICGDMTGAMANKSSVEYIRDKYKNFAIKFPQLQTVLQGNENLSYTQWEAYLAIYHEKHLFIVSPAATAIKDNRNLTGKDQAALQAKHLNNLKLSGYYAEIHFNNEDELAKKLYQSKLGEIIFGAPKHKPANLPYHSIGTAFKGREDFIKDLNETFNKTNGISGIAIYALGGMGKTRLAVEYARRYFYDYTALLFVNANSPQLLVANIAKLAAPDILDLPESAEQDEEAKYADVKNWLNENTGWLLILDNIDTNEAAEKAEEIFSALQQGHVLITARVSNWSRQIKKKQLGVLDNEAATAFLLETTDEGREKKDNDEDAARQIAKDLGYFALALEQARAYIITKELSFDSYRNAWQQNNVKIMEWFDKRQMQYNKSLAITWQTSFDELSEAGTILLNRLAWLAPDPIPKSLLNKEIPGVDNIDGENAWEELKQYSLAKSSDDKKSFTIHKLVQEVARSKMDKASELKTLTESLSWLDIAFDGDALDVRDWPVLEPLIPHLLYITEYAQINEINEPTSTMMNNVGLIFLNKAQYSIAEPLFRKALEISEKDGSNNFQVAIRLNNLAQLLQETNRLPEAEPLMRKALEIDEQNFGPNHSNVSRDLNNLSELLRTSKRFEEAEPLIRRALEIDEQIVGLNHPNVAIRLNNLSQLLQDTNRSEEAEPLMQRALEIDEKNFGPNHPNVARDLNNLAEFLRTTNRVQEAEPLIRRALEIDEQIFGSNHPSVAIRLNNLAQLLQDTNRLQEAEPLLKRAFLIFKANFGDNHPNTITVSNNYKFLLQAISIANT